MYKDKDRQREANRLQMQRSRAKGNTNQVVNQGNTECPRVTDQSFTRLLAADVGAPIVRVSKPGDADYVPQCETTRAFIDGRDKRPETGKRGKDIKCFADLPPDVQEVIHKLSTIDGKIDQRVKTNRTAIAVNYQHLFPGRYNSTGATYTGKPTASESERYKPASGLSSGKYNIVSKPGDGVCTPEWRAERGR